ncbi:ShlB/FhaC/HecB family hemolysin secretion/activation protein [Xenorhabdus bovienii]|uniref:TpsB protein n=2 Tax=Xenorhabdus bovienii TaxID=40576 RepID=A0A077NKF8_XENBV|nr:ShlB/FhaC/HecB family hemolysin secretion/activation protein [Xenorhabdus bovienii]CDG98385.1 TpsB protein [Xenorhabdus bovienii str. puntauvense]CDH00698.1 TpsB protein [Xenorhabdus bovienii str. feltiae Moldova]
MKYKKIINIALCTFILFSGKLIASSDFYSNISPLEQEIINQKQKNILEESQKKENMGSEITIHQPIAPVSTPDNELSCQLVNHISFEHSEKMPKSKQKLLIEPYISKCLTTNDIDFLIHKASAYYMENGYITSRAFLKSQDLSKGNLIINIVEGKINSITINSENPFFLKLVFPNMIGKTLNLRDLEQGLEQLNRMSSYQVTIDIQPSKRIGYSDIILKQTSSKNPIRVDIGIDNSGQKSSGKNQLNTTLELDNILHLADSWTISANKNSDFRNNHKNWNVTSGLRIPYGYWLLSYQNSLNKSFQYIPINSKDQRYTGEGQSHNLKATSMLYRDGKQKISLNVGFTHRKTENSIGDVKLSLNSPTLSTLNIGLNYSSTLLGGYFTFNPTLTKGLDIFGATKDDNLKDTQKSKFYKISSSSSYFKPITNNIYYLTSVYGQYSPNNLYASERLSLGGQYSIRGFKEQNLVGNLGGYWRNEINWKIVQISKLGELSLKSSLDTGWIKKEEKRSSDGGKLTGTSLGLSLNNAISNHSFTIGKPLNYPNYLKPDNWVIYWSTYFTF